MSASPATAQAWDGPEVEWDMWFEDFTAGQSFTSRGETMTRERIVAFGQEFDPQPQHLSEDAAATSQFGELVASGWHTAAVTMRLQYEAGLGRIQGGGMGAQVDKLTWVRPVRPGDTLRVLLEVVATRPSQSRPSRGVITFRTTTLNQDDEPVQVMTAAVLAPRRPA